MRRTSYFSSAPTKQQDLIPLFVQICEDTESLDLI